MNPVARCFFAVLLTSALALGACSPEPELGPLQAGTATVRMPVPLGIGTMGYNGLFGTPSSPTPYADRYPGTTRMHGHPTFTAVALSRGEGAELIFLRSDTIAVVQQLRDAVVAELETRTGRNYDDALIISATHTHAGPGRFIQGGLYDLIADTFVPAFFAGLVDAMADAVEGALTDLSPAEFGMSLIDAPDAHSDRRCEDGVDYTNDQLGLMVVRKDGALDAVLINYAIHGTILGIGDFTLSQDVSGAIEEQVAAALGVDVPVVLLNSWAGDVAPSSPGLDIPFGLSVQPEGYGQMQEIGLYLGQVVAAAIDSVEMSTEPEIASRTYRYPIGHEAIGYAWGEFDYPWGGVYCDAAGATCEEVLDHETMVDGCIPFPEDSPAPMQSLFTLGRLGDAVFTTWSGEATTGLAERVLAEMRSASGQSEALFFGYGNDYLGYQLEEEDWWHGGYEASGSMWGPQQGEYMAGVQAEVFSHWLAGEDLPLSFTEPSIAGVFDLGNGVVWQHEEALERGTVVSQPEATYASDGVASFSVAGSHPGLGLPLAVLQRDAGAGFEDVSGPTGATVDSDGYAFWVELSPEPSYADEEGPVARRFVWTFSLPLTTRAATWSEPSAAGYRFSVSFPGDDGDLFSESFSVGD
jgi:neutral ceramidase